MSQAQPAALLPSCQGQGEVMSSLTVRVGNGSVLSLSLLPRPTGMAWEQTCQEGQCRGSCCPRSVSAATWPVPELAHPVPQSRAMTGSRLKVVPLPERLGLLMLLHHQQSHALSHQVPDFSPLDYC